MGCSVIKLKAKQHDCLVGSPREIWKRNRKMGKKLVRRKKRRLTGWINGIYEIIGGRVNQRKSKT